MSSKIWVKNELETLEVINTFAARIQQEESNIKFHGYVPKCIYVCTTLFIALHLLLNEQYFPLVIARKMIDIFGHNLTYIFQSYFYNYVRNFEFSL